jgi:hypothetical protein
MPIFEGSVIITCVAVVLWLINSRHHTQRALIWWHDRQYAKMCQEGEAIRNGLLQESFVFRRHLELSALNDSEVKPPHHQYYLTTIENFHHSLRNLSDYLLPAHVDESLSLAIKHLFVKCKLDFPELHLEMDMTTDIDRDTSQFRRIVLMVLEEILNLIFLNIYSHNFKLVSLSVDLKNKNNLNELMVKFHYDGGSHSLLEYRSDKRTRIIEYEYLRRVFNFLSHGKCWYRYQDNTEIWYFHWQDVKTTKNNNDARTMLDKTNLSIK